MAMSFPIPVFSGLDLWLHVQAVVCCVYLLLVGVRACVYFCVFLFLVFVFFVCLCLHEDL